MGSNSRTEVVGRKTAAFASAAYCETADLFSLGLAIWAIHIP